MTESASFATFVKDSREKKKNEALAQQFLGGNRGRKNTPSAGSGAGSGAKPRNASEKPTLLSRISGAGVQKRSSSAKAESRPSITNKWQHDLHSLNNPNGQSAPKGRNNRTVSASQVDRNKRNNDKFANALDRNATVVAPQNDGTGFNIKGVASAGPFIVIASNFAPGTTAADIEAVMSPHGGEALGCRLLSASPTVMVELQFAKKEGAENVIATFNNQKADGRQLYVYMKTIPTPTSTINAPAQPRAMPTLFSESNNEMEVDTTAGAGVESYQGVPFSSGENSRKGQQGGAFNSGENNRKGQQDGRGGFRGYGRQNPQDGLTGFSGNGRQDPQGGSFGFNSNLRTEPPRGPRRRY